MRGGRRRIEEEGEMEGRGKGRMRNGVACHERIRAGGEGKIGGWRWSIYGPPRGLLKGAKR
jgi:hypothetical protein